MTKVFPNEIACKIPGVTPVLNFVPYQSDMRNKTETVEEEKYVLTTDMAFGPGEYYKRDGSDYVLAKAGTEEEVAAGTADYVVGAEIPANTYYTKMTESKEVVTTTIYDRYTTGKVVKLDTENGYPKTIEIPIEIVKTTVVASGPDQMTTREHTLALWADRETAVYVPYCDRLESDDFRESGRIFR